MNQNNFGVHTCPLPSSLSCKNQRRIDNKFKIDIFVFRKYETPYGIVDISVEKDLMVKEIEAQLIEKISNDYHYSEVILFRTNGEPYDKNEVIIKIVNDNVVITDDLFALYYC